MSDINKITFTGNLTKDAEQRYTGSGTAVLSFDVANNTGYGDNKRTNYFRCAIFGKRAEGRLGEFLKTGTAVVIVGELSQECRDHNGKTYCDLKVFVNDLKLAGGGNVENKPANRHNQNDMSKPSTGAGPQGTQGGMDDFDSDIPFAQHQRGMLA